MKAPAEGRAEMLREDIIKMLASWFGIAPNEDGEYDTDDYEWQAGCYKNGKWFCLAEIVECLDSNL